MFKWNPEKYSTNSSRQEAWATEALTRLNVTGSENILDVGCGDGKITAALSGRLTRGRITGLDSSEEMIRFATEKYPKKNYPRLDFIRGDATNLPFKKKFDLIISFACLHWVEDHPAVLKGIFQSLKPSGKTLLQFAGKGNAADVLELLPSIISDTKWARYFRDFKLPWIFYSPEEYQVLVRESGLLTKNIRLIPKPTFFTADGLKSWMTPTWLPYLERCPNALQEDFLDQVARAYLQKFPLSKNGQTELLLMRLEVEAERPLLAELTP